MIIVPTNSGTPKLTFYDTFDDGDGLPLDSNWTYRVGYLEQYLNACTPLPYQAFAYCGTASWNTPMNYDDVRVTAHLFQAGSKVAWIGLGCGTDYQLFADLDLINDAVVLWISQPDGGYGWRNDGNTQIDVAYGYSGYDNDELVLQRVGNVYTVKVNGTTQIEWTDSGNLMPRGANYRMVAIGGYNDTAGFSGWYDWTAEDL